jgi:DNA-binding transcriptional MerR regulator
MINDLLTVREVSQRLNISESTIRGYCRRGLVKPKRDKSRNWRWFDKNDVKIIKNLIQPR